MLQGEVVKEYLTKFPDSASMTLAQLIYKENKSLFSDVESARSVIRYWRGSLGDRDRLKLTDKSHLKEAGGSFAKLPEGLTTLQNWGTFKVTGDNKVLLLSDAHIPYHNKTALEKAVEKGKSFGISVVLFNGDWLDHFSISRWQKDPRQKNFPKERETALQSFEWLREQFPNARFIFKMGNHEERYENYMELKAPELLGIPNFDFENVFEFDNYGIEMVKDKRPIKLNQLFCIHGHEYKVSISNPVNPARGVYLRASKNCICGHFHQPSSHSENNIDDGFTSCWSTGHLGEAHPKYMPLNKWSHGFAVIEMSGFKSFQVHNYKIINNEIYMA